MENIVPFRATRLDVNLCMSTRRVKQYFNNNNNIDSYITHLKRIITALELYYTPLTGPLYFIHKPSQLPLEYTACAA